MTCPNNQKGEHSPRLPVGAHDYEYIPFCATRVCNLCQDHAGKDSCNNCIWQRPAGQETSPFYEKPDDDDQDDLFSVPGDKPICMASENCSGGHDFQPFKGDITVHMDDKLVLRCSRCGSLPTPPFNGDTPVQRNLKPNLFTVEVAERVPLIEILTVPLEFDVQLGRGPGNSAVTNVPWTVVQHSPDGFEWSYGGSGPADLALNILNAFLPPVAGPPGSLEPAQVDDTGDYVVARFQCYHGVCSKTAWALHQAFKWRFIAVMPKLGGTILKAEILDWLERVRDPIAHDEAVIVAKEPPK